MNYPTARHKNCKESTCSFCFSDSNILASFLEVKTGISREDHLGAYHSFLKREYINPETEWGWWSEEVFKKENLDRYIQSRIGDLPEEDLTVKINRIRTLKQVTETDKNFKIEVLIKLIEELTPNT